MSLADTPSDRPLLFEIDEGIARITLNRPASANAIDTALAYALERAVARSASDEVSVVVIRGAGPRFCAGGDVMTFLAAADRSDALRRLAESLDRSMRMLAEMPKPVIVGVQGAIAGAGLGFILAADVVIAASGTKFATAFTAIGLTPDSGVSALLPQMIGLRRALEMTLTSRTLTSEEAADWGLVTRVVDSVDALDDATEQLATALATGPFHAYGQSRRLLRAAAGRDREAQGADEAGTIANAVATSEAEALIERFTSRGSSS